MKKVQERSVIVNKFDPAKISFLWSTEPPKNGCTKYISMKLVIGVMNVECLRLLKMFSYNFNFWVFNRK